MPAPSLRTPRRAALAVSLAILLAAAPATADQVIPDDLIVQGSICGGNQCINNESFGFDTIRLKQNLLRLGFVDTSVGNYPSTDWQIAINDPDGQGFDEFFAIDNLDTGARIFRLHGNAPANSLYVDALGNVGLGTSAPGLELHLLDSDTPGLRLQQTTDEGNPAAVWDIAGNEANFFVRHDGQLPFRIRPGAPTSTLMLDDDGDVGIAANFNSDPTAALHVWRNDGSALLRIEEAASDAAPRTLLELVNHGQAVMQFSNSAAGIGWNVAGDTGFSIASDGAGTPQFALAANGDLAITGTLSQGSSRSLKTAIQAVDAAAVFAAVMALPVYEWSYRESAAGERHLGPMAEDFHAAFGLGADPARLAPSDVAGVALVAVQELAEQVEERKRDITRIRARIDALEAQAR